MLPSSIRWVGLNFPDGEYEQAEQYLLKAHEIDPEEPVHLYHLGRCAERVGNLDDAIAFFTQSLLLGRDFEEMQDARQRLIQIRKTLSVILEGE